MSRTLILYDGKMSSTERVADTLGCLVGNCQIIEMGDAPEDFGEYDGVCLIFNFYGVVTAGKPRNFLINNAPRLIDKRIACVGVGFSDAGYTKYVVDLERQTGLGPIAGYFITRENETPRTGYDIGRIMRAPVSAMPEADLARAIDDFIMEHNTLALATADGSYVRCTPLEYIYDEKLFYIITEGGNKFRGILGNGRISAAIYEPYTAMDAVEGLQISGRAELVPYGGAEYMSVMAMKNITPDVLASLPVRLYVVRVTPHTYEFTNSAFARDGYDVKQILKTAFSRAGAEAGAQFAVAQGSAGEVPAAGSAAAHTERQTAPAPGAAGAAPVSGTAGGDAAAYANPVSGTAGGDAAAYANSVSGTADGDAAGESAGSDADTAAQDGEQNASGSGRGYDTDAEKASAARDVSEIASALKTSQRLPGDVPSGDLQSASLEEDPSEVPPLEPEPSSAERYTPEKRFVVKDKPAMKRTDTEEENTETPPETAAAEDAAPKKNVDEYGLPILDMSVIAGLYPREDTASGSEAGVSGGTAAQAWNGGTTLAQNPGGSGSGIRQNFQSGAVFAGQHDDGNGEPGGGKSSRAGASGNGSGTDQRGDSRLRGIDASSDEDKIRDRDAGRSGRRKSIRGSAAGPRNDDFSDVDDTDEKDEYDEEDVEEAHPSRRRPDKKKRGGVFSRIGETLGSWLRVEDDEEDDEEDDDDDDGSGDDEG